MPLLKLRRSRSEAREKARRRDEDPAIQSDAPDALIRLEADFAEDGTYGKRVLEVTREEVRLLEWDEVPSLRVPMEEIASARNEPLVGGGRLEITTTTGAILPVVTYSQSVAAQFSEAARGIEQLAKGEEFSINLKKERTRCPNCNRLLPEKDGICPACLKRGKTLLRIAGYLGPYRWRAVGLAGLSILGTIINLAPPYLQGTIVNQVLSPHKDLPLLWRLMAIWLFVLAAGVGVQIMIQRITVYVGSRIAADLRSAVYRAVEFLQVSYFDKKQVGAITSRITQDTDRVWGFLIEGVPFLVTNTLLLLGIAAFLLWTNWKLALCIMAPLPLVAFISAYSFRSIARFHHRFSQKWARFHMMLNESLSGIRVVKAFAQEDHENARFQERNQELCEAGMAVDLRWQTTFGVMSFFVSCGTLIHWTFGGYMVYANQLSLGDFWRIQAYLSLLYGPMQWFAQVNNWFSRAMAGAERIFEVMGTTSEAYGDASEHRALTGEVAFDNVRFGYDKSNPVLKGLSFTAAPGEMIGLVGKSGAGKSTTINLLCRFYEPDAGAIKIDGTDYRELSLQDMRRQIGIVLQEPFLFNGTIAENIAYGKPGADFDAIVEAARAANAHGFILGKADGYDTIVGERGAKLSGGERQRISIARAILHDPRILILDEATSSVDVETEKQIQGAIAHLIAGRTTFAIAHRLATLRNASRLVVLDKGEVVEIGSHAELMDKKGVFYDLVQTQSQINEIIGT